MATDIYEYDTVDPSLLGWEALLTNNFDKVEDNNPTILRYQVLSGESIVSGEVLNIFDGGWRQARADGIRQPGIAIALESGISGEYVRGRSIGPLTSTSFNFVGAGEYIYLGSSGELTDSLPSSNPEIIGFSLNQNELYIRPQRLISAAWGGITGNITDQTDLAAYIIPPGVEADFAGATAPTGWLIEDGSAISRITYANLFAAIGTTHGSGDGVNTFNIPDSRDRVRVGKGTSGTFVTLGSKGGAETHLHSADPVTYQTSVDGSVTYAGAGALPVSTFGHWHDSNPPAFNTASGSNNMKYIVSNRIIKY